MKSFSRSDLFSKLLLVFVFFFLSCNSTSTKLIGDEGKWILENKERINSELNSRISLRINENEKNRLNWVEESFVVTEYDSTILGSLAKMIKNLNKCFYVEYTYTPDLNKKKIITILRDDNCNERSIIPFSLIDSTQYFKITFDTLY